MKKFLLILFLVPFIAKAQVKCNNYPATDALGRKLPGYKVAGPPKKNKFVGVFYFIWHTHYSEFPPLNTKTILDKDPSAIHNFDSPSWPKESAFYFWGEPLFGYYRDTDDWVLRKQAEMLADAGVDVIILDGSNGELYKESYTELFKVFAQARADGVLAPQIAFMMPFAITSVASSELYELYTGLYKPGLYKNLWFKWQGKPLIMAYPELVKGIADTALSDEIKNFFTYRPAQGRYNEGPERPDHWAWLEIYPQHGFGKKPNGGFEETSVGVAQNWSKEKGLTAMNSPGVFDRNYTALKGEQTAAGAVNFGYNFQEQWNRALQLNPDFIFITGWNEWIAGRYKTWQDVPNAFPDEFSEEASRDIEPMKGGHADNYYYQMAGNIRRFKGVAPPNAVSPPVLLKADENFPDWSRVLPVFKSYKGNTMHRDFDGWKGYHYVNNTGRNDIVSAKVARDKQFIYFYVETAQKLSPKTDHGWMRLFISINHNKNTSWEGYDYVINRVNPSATAVLEKSVGGWHWTKVGTVNYKVNGNMLEIKVPRILLALNGAIDFEFKWSDNMQQEGNIIDFLINGDVAPSGRFNYHYTAWN